MTFSVNYTFPHSRMPLDEVCSVMFRLTGYAATTFFIRIVHINVEVETMMPSFNVVVRTWQVILHSVNHVPSR